MHIVSMPQHLLSMFQTVQFVCEALLCSIYSICLLKSIITMMIVTENIFVDPLKTINRTTTTLSICTSDEGEQLLLNHRQFPFCNIRNPV